MPITYNGIGTSYAGKKNLQKRPGPCPHCQGEVELSSYDTRLYFVILFIPLIPLKRMRILDYCPSCTRHYAMEAEKWETNKQLEVSGALDRFRSDSTPETGMAAHQHMLNFHLLDQAKAFRQILVEKFADNAKVHAYLGQSLTHFGKLDEAEPYFVKALDLHADLPEARIGVAASHLKRGQIDEARRLLDFLEKPGASQLHALQPLIEVALAYQQAQRHEEALSLFSQVQNELPDLGQIDWFRKAVKRSEKSLRRPDTQLPQAPFSFRALFTLGEPSTTKTLTVFGVMLGLLVLWFICSNEYIRRHRAVHLVNGFPAVAVVKIPSVGEFKIASNATELTLPEGRYHASITGPVQQELDFEIEANYVDRWFNNRIWVLNVGGEAILVRTAVTYAANPPPASIDFIFGQTFQEVDGITHPFRELPKELSLKHDATRTLVQLSVLHSGPLDVVSFYEQKKDYARALAFMENWATNHLDDAQMFQRYLAASERSGQTNRALAFLRQGVAVRPVKIEWHRAYQSALQWIGDGSRTRAEYQKLLDAEPTNSALLYLRGRIEPDRLSATPFYERSLAADARNPYPLFAMAYERMSSGDWTRARVLLEQAIALKPDDRGYESYLTSARLASGDAAAVEREARQRLANRSSDFFEACRLVDALAFQGKKGELSQFCKEFSGSMRARYGDNGRAASEAISCRALYALGDLDEWGRTLDKAQPEVVEAFKTQRLIETGKLAEAAQALIAQTKGARASILDTLSLAVAFRRAGNSRESDHWLAPDVSHFDAGEHELIHALKLLTQDHAPSQAEIDALVLPVQVKPIVLVGLATKYPELEKDLFPLVRKLNIDRGFPYHFIARITGGVDQPH